MISVSLFDDGCPNSGEMALASPAIVGERLLIRTESRLYSIRQAIEE